MQNTNHALIVCQQIHRQGKTPSVALVRQYSHKTLTIPEIVKALQMWKSNPQVVVEETIDKATKPSLNLEERVQTLEKKVAELTLKLESLMQR